MIIDSHVHILPAAMRDARERLAGLDPWFDMCHQGARAIVTADELLATMDASGIDRSVCFGWPFADPEHCAEVNDHLIEVQRAHADRLTCFATVSPARPGAVEELERCAAAGLRGAGELNADAQGFDLATPAIDEVAAACTDLGIPLVLHCSEPVGHDYPGKGTATPDLVAAFAMRHPALKLVCAHLGGGLPFYAHMPEVADLCRRLWFDTAAGPFLYQPTRVPRGRRSLRSRPVALRIGLSAAPREALHRRLCAGGSDRRRASARDGRERGAPAWSVTTCPSRYKSVSQHPRLRSRPLAHSLWAEKPAPASRSFASFVTRIGGLRPPHPWLQPTLR